MVLPILGISRLGQMTDRLSSETELASLLGLPRFFDLLTGHDDLNRFAKGHVSQLDKVKHQLLLLHGSCSTQPIVVVDVDAQTHTLESRKRDGAVVGYNRKKRGKPCDQWNLAFVCNEAIAQRLAAGNTHGQSVLLALLDEVAEKLNQPVMIARKDYGDLSGKSLSALVERQLQRCLSCRFDSLLSQGVTLDESKWQKSDDQTRLYDVGLTQVVETCSTPFRVVLVEKKQTPFPGSKSKRTLHRYGLCEKLAFNLDAWGAYDFYHSSKTP